MPTQTENEVYRKALEQLKIHPLLTRRNGPLENSALHIVRKALSAVRN